MRAAGATARSACTALAVLVFVACEPMAPTSLADVQFPEGFAIDVHREVTLTADGEPSDAARLSVVADGRTLFEGPARFAVDHPLTLRVPPGVTAVRVLLRDGGEQHASDSPIEDGSVHVSLGEI